MAEHIGGSYDIISHTCLIRSNLKRATFPQRGLKWSKGIADLNCTCGCESYFFCEQTNEWKELKSNVQHSFSLVYHQLNTIEFICTHRFLFFSFLPAESVSKYSVNQHSHIPTKVLFSETRLSKLLFQYDTETSKKDTVLTSTSPKTHSLPFFLKIPMKFTSPHISQESGRAWMWGIQPVYGLVLLADVQEIKKILCGKRW